MTTTPLRGGSSMIDINAAEEPLEQYIREMQPYPLLSSEEVVALAQRLEQGDEEAFQTLVSHNLRLVVPLAKLYIRPGVQLADLIQEGNLGLMHAVRKFDYRKINSRTGKPFAFSTYATWWIRSYVRRYMLEKLSVVVFPVHQAEQIASIERIEHQLHETLGREPKPEEIAEAYNARQKYANKRITAKRVEEIAIWRKTPTSLDAPVTPKGGNSNSLDDINTLADWLTDTTQPDHVTLIEHAALKGAIEQALDKLSARERAIIRGRFGFDGQELPLDTLAKRYKLTRQRIQQVEQNALRKLFSPLQQWTEAGV